MPNINTLVTNPEDAQALQELRGDVHSPADQEYLDEVGAELLRARTTVSNRTGQLALTAEGVVERQSDIAEAINAGTYQPTSYDHGSRS